MTSFDRVLTLGAGGMIGSYVDFGIRPSLEECDITDADSVANIVAKEKPSAIILLAGATDMKRCEEDPAYAYELNVRGAYNVAQAAREAGAVLVYASSSRVFKGDKGASYTEDDAPAPDTHYGRTKHIGELIVQSLVPEHIIARTVWVFGGGPKLDNKFYGKMLKQLLSPAGDIVAINDVQGSPTYGKDYIAKIQELLGNGERGTFHIANSGTATRYDIAKKMAELVQSNAPIRAVDRNFFPEGSSLPANESVASKRATLRPWQKALAEYLSLEWNTAQ